MYKLNDKIKNLTPYEPLKGEYKIRLDANESFKVLPKNIQDDVNSNLEKLSINRYPDPMADALCENFSKFYGVKKEHVVASNGSDELISLIFTGFLMKGETFATLENDFSMYRFYGELSECKSVLISKDKNFEIDIDLCVEICKNSNVKLLIFSNPCNPTSVGIKKDDVLKIASSLEDTLVIADEAYMDFWDESVLHDYENYPNLLVLKTCSKAFGMAGIRAGFAVGNKMLINAIKAFKSPYNLDSYAQCIAGTVFSYKDECVSAINEIIDSTKELQVMLDKFDGFEDVEVLKSSTNFVVMKTKYSVEIYEYMLKNSVAIRCFKSFIRVTAGSKEENAEFNKYLTEFFTSKGWK